MAADLLVDAQFLAVVEKGEPKDMLQLLNKFAPELSSEQRTRIEDTVVEKGELSDTLQLLEILFCKFTCDECTRVADAVTKRSDVINMLQSLKKSSSERSPEKRTRIEDTVIEKGGLSDIQLLLEIIFCKLNYNRCAQVEAILTE